MNESYTNNVVRGCRILAIALNLLASGFNLAARDIFPACIFALVAWFLLVVELVSQEGRE